MKKCPFCAEEIQDNSEVCELCWEKIIQNEIIDNHNINNKNLIWLWWWLVFVIFGLILSFLSFSFSLWLDYVSIINDGSLAQLINFDSFSYVNWYLTLFLFEFLATFWFIILTWILIYLFFCKYKFFPLLYKIYLFCYLLFLCIDYVLSTVILKDYISWDMSNYIVEIIQAFIYVFIWWSYVHLSKRVKNTFIIDDYKSDKNSFYIFVFIIILMVCIFLIQIDYSKFSYNEYEYWTDICKQTYWENSYYTWEQDKEWFLCDCKEWYWFWWENGEKCILLNK